MVFVARVGWSERTHKETTAPFVTKEKNKERHANRALWQAMTVSCDSIARQQTYTQTRGNGLVFAPWTDTE